MKVIKFTLKDGAIHEFSSDTHGEDFAATAAQYEADNKAVIDFRTDTEVEVTPESAPEAPAPEVAPEEAPAPAPEAVPEAPAAEEPAPEAPAA